MSEGFHPKPRMSFPSALAVGIAGLDEVMEVELTAEYAPDELVSRLRAAAPTGLAIQGLEPLPPESPKARVDSVRYEVPVPPSQCAGLDERIEQLRSSPSWPVQRPAGKTPVDLVRWLMDVALCDGVLSMRLRVGTEASAGPRDVLAALGLADLERAGACLTRTAVELAP